MSLFEFRDETLPILASSPQMHNRLTRVISVTVTTKFVYNGDGTCVTRTDANGTVYYLGNWYVVKNTGAITKYYYFGGKRCAMRQRNNVTYLHGDHLGTTSVTGGASTSTQTYYPYGSVRTTSSKLPTDYTFTGQKNCHYSNIQPISGF